jgi:hypothetical protein
MGVRVWFFLQPRQGELRPLPLGKVEAFFFRDGCLPADEEGFVRYAEVSVLLDNRRAVEVARVGYFSTEFVLTASWIGSATCKSWLPSARRRSGICHSGKRLEVWWGRSTCLRNAVSII